MKQRASASTQRQALNALVFLLREGLKRQLGPIDFRRAVLGRKVPTVLSREEGQLRFGRRSGSSWLMAEIM